MKKGLLITVEGPDGAGKSTQLDFIKSYFEEKGTNPIFLREPGSTKIGEEIREILLSDKNKEMGNKTEMFLYAAARAQLVEQVIKPELEKGSVVVCDRYIDSSLAYQGYGRNLGSMVEEINMHAIDSVMPDLTIFLSLDIETGLKRASKSSGGNKDRIEQESNDFHQRVLMGYEEIAKKYSNRIIKVNATLSIEEVSNVIKEHLDKVFL